MTRYTVRVDGQVYEADVEDPPAPVCGVCGHELCPCCAEVGYVSCDMIVRDGDGESDFCACDDCKVDATAFEAFVVEVRRRKNLACFGGDGCVFSLRGGSSE